MMWSANCLSMKFKCPAMETTTVGAEFGTNALQSPSYLWFLTRNRSGWESQRRGETLESSATTLVPPTVDKSGIASASWTRREAPFPVGAFKIKGGTATSREAPDRSMQIGTQCV